MPGKKHQFIVGLLVKQMREYGCKINYLDGKYHGEKLEMPPQILRHRPDIFGITGTGIICIGEAKTESDLKSARTREQLTDFANLVLNGKPCEVFWGIPRLCKDQFNKILEEQKLLKLSNIHVLFVPEEIIND